VVFSPDSNRPETAMRRIALAACALLLVLTAPTRAAEPEGVLLCAAEGGGFDCEKSRCNPSKVTAGRDMRLDFVAKTMCALRGTECRDPKAIHHAMLEEKTIVAAISADGATMLFRIAPDLKMAMVFVIGAQRVISFTGTCRRATSG
jgi:hypothetical protein